MFGHNGNWRHKGQYSTAHAENYGIDPEHVMAIGDNESDATMFDVVKFSVAVANADDLRKVRLLLLQVPMKIKEFCSP